MFLVHQHWPLRIFEKWRMKEEPMVSRQTGRLFGVFGWEGELAGTEGSADGAGEVGLCFSSVVLWN